MITSATRNAETPVPALSITGYYMPGKTRLQGNEEAVVSDARVSGTDTGKEGRQQQTPGGPALAKAALPDAPTLPGAQGNAGARHGGVAGEAGEVRLAALLTILPRRFWLYQQKNMFW